MTLLHATTPLLDVAYESGGPADGWPVLLLHGWPDDVRTYDKVAPQLQEAGFRTIAPWLRGFGATTFRSPDTMRSGQIAAMAQDALDLLDALGIDRVPIVGHDWGARIAYLLASTTPSRVTRIAALSLGWTPGELATPSFEQASRFWYQWFMATGRGAAAVREHGRAFARFMWDSWGPSGWFDEAPFERTAHAFDNPDWAAVTLHSYRVRWGQADPDPRYDELERRSKAARTIDVPTLVIHGTDDRCVLVESSAGKERHFTRSYRRELLERVGHFPTREAPQAVASLLTAFLQITAP
jgi:pimeloyl-ACP methyl ester carboxylesterase